MKKLLLLGLITIIFIAGCTQQTTMYVCSDGSSVSNPTLCPEQEEKTTTSTCGNQFCESGEDCNNCPKDCGLCQKLIIQEASCTRSINPNDPGTAPEPCGAACPRFTVQATVYNSNNYEVEIKYGYWGGFVNAYADKRNTESCAPTYSGEQGIPLCGLFDSVKIPAKSSLKLSSGSFDLTYTGTDIKLSYIQVSYATNLEAKGQGSETVKTEPYPLSC
jgi:hypothetical protein